MRGTITAVTGRYDLHVQSERGEIDAVRMHAGTIINPTGLRLRAGMPVTMLGRDAGGVFEANEIDTPYRARPSRAAAGAVGVDAGFGRYGGGFGGFGFGLGF